MQNKGILSVFHKHLEREVLNTAEFQRVINSIAYLGKMHLFKSVISPIFSLLKSRGESAIEAGCVGVDIVDSIAENTIELIEGIADKTLKLPVEITGDIAHRLILSTGRMFYAGASYKGPFPTEKGVRSLRKMPSTEKEAAEFVKSAVGSAKYEDILRIYAPYTWESIKLGYSAGELLNIENISFDRKNTTMVFDASLYEEGQDKILKKHNVWELKQETEKGVAVHKAEITDML